MKNTGAAIMHIIDLIALILLIVGGLNWGLVGVANFNLVSTLFDSLQITHIVYIVVGLAAVWKIVRFR